MATLGPGLGNVISANTLGDYNTIQSAVAKVLGPPTDGAPRYGYNQAVSSSQVAVGNKVTLSHWLNVRADAIKARGHQTGSGSESNNISIPTNANLIRESLRFEYYNYAVLLDTYRDTLGTGQFTIDTANTAQRLDDWNGNLISTVTMNFGDVPTIRAFFNAGGKIWISSGRSGGTVGSPKNIDWTTMLGNGTTQPSGFGTVEFGYTETATVAGTASASGTTYNLGWYDMTTSDQLVFRKQAPAGNYAENDYEIYARKNVGSTQLILSIQFRDDDTGDTAIDEDVDGNLRSYIRQVRPSGSNVSVPTPTATGSGLL